MFNLFTTGAFTNFISGSAHFPTLWYCLQSGGLENTAALANTPRAPDFVPDFVFLCQLPAPKSIQDVQFIHDRCLHKLYFRFSPFPYLMVMPAIRGTGKYSLQSGGWETQHWLTRREHRTSCQTLSSSVSYRPRKVFRVFNLFTTGAFTSFISGSTHLPTLW